VKTERTGFAGFDDLVSDLSGLPDLLVPKPAPAPAPADTQAARHAPSPQPDNKQSPKPEKAIPRGWRTAIVLALFLFALYAVGSMIEKPPIPAQATSPGQSAVQAALSPLESGEQRIPLIGNGQVLSTSEIRYCAAQKLRITGATSFVDNTSILQVDRLNALIQDYNSRCSTPLSNSNFSSEILSEVEGKRALFILQGKFDLYSSIRQAPLPLPKPQPPKKSPVDARTASKEPLVVPDNATLDRSGRDWTCDYGYSREESRCILIIGRAHARLNASGHDLTCEPGFKLSGPICQPILLPAHSRLDIFGRDWVCELGFEKAGDQCNEIVQPK